MVGLDAADVTVATAGAAVLLDILANAGEEHASAFAAAAIFAAHRS